MSADLRPTLNRVLAIAFVCVAILGSRQTAAAAPLFVVDIDTSALAGTQADLAFDLVDGDGLANTTVTIETFATDAVLGPASGTSSVTGALPGLLSITDADFFNEALQSLSLGQFIRFVINANSANAGPVADQLSLFLLGPGGVPLYATTDPTGADALLALDLTASSTSVTVFDDATKVAAVPEPATLVLLAAGCVGLASRGRRKTA